MALTRAQLRRLIGARLQQPFFKKIGDSSTATSNGTTTTLIDTTLAQADDYWNRFWIYFPAADVVREISDFANSSKTLTWVEPVSSTAVTASGVTYELWSQFTAKEVNNAISAALAQAWPYFFRVTEGWLVIQNDTGTRYSLTGLSPTPRFIGQVWMENLVSSVTGTVTSAGTQAEVIDSAASFTSADVGKQVRIYSGTSKGDYRTVLTVDSSTKITVSSNFTTTLDTTSKYRLAATTDETRTFEFMTAWDLDSESAPTVLTIGGHPYGWEGFLLKLVYESDVADMTTESSTVAVPQQWLIWAVLEQLYFTKALMASHSEEPMWSQAYQTAQRNALMQAMANRFQHIDGTIRDLTDMKVSVQPEYPF